jgi:hypothetical protein
LKNSYKLAHQKIITIKIQLLCYTKAAIGLNSEDPQSEDSVLAGKNGKLIQEIKQKNFLCIFQLFLYRQQINTIF